MNSNRDASALLLELLSAGAVPVIEIGRLRIFAPPGVLTPERRDAIAARLPVLRSLVAAQWRAREECIAPTPCRRMSRCAWPTDGRPCLMPPTCCLCGGPLPAGHRYLCTACVASSSP